MQAEPRFPDAVKIRVPAGLPSAVDAVARRQGTTPSQWMRTALLASLAAEGVRLSPEGWVVSEGSAR
jgi:hypothetical protein